MTRRTIVHGRPASVVEAAGPEASWYASVLDVVNGTGVEIVKNSDILTDTVSELTLCR
jgi:hypothetical protein